MVQLAHLQGHPKLDELPVFVLYVAIHFFDNGIGELLCIWLLKGLMVVHDVTYHSAWNAVGFLMCS
jgi:hypothetical protein